VKCPERGCLVHRRTVSPEGETTLCLPRSILGWEVFCWIGQRTTVATDAVSEKTSVAEPVRPPDPAAAVVLDYCTVVQDILNYNQGGDENRGQRPRRSCSKTS
jgi:hypothetical protein